MDGEILRIMYAQKLTEQAELGIPSSLEYVHSSLADDLKTMTAENYGHLLSYITSGNKQDQALNPHLPKLELYDSSNSGIPDAVRAIYPDKTTVSKDDPSPGTQVPKPSDNAGQGQTGLPRQPQQKKPPIN